MAGQAPVDLNVTTEGLQALGRALGAEADGKALRRDLAKDMRKALAPAVDAARSELMSMGSHGLPRQGEPLRRAVAKQIKAEARLSGRSTGARIKARKRGMPRGFDNAPKRLNSNKGWRRQVFGRGAWVQQMGRPGWFDDTVARDVARYRAAVVAAMEAAARRIAGR